MSVKPSPDLLRQQHLVHAMRKNFPRSVMKETHISWVIIAGCNTYKIKKSLNLGFLDFSALDARRFYCEEELRLNRRLAPDLYLDVISIGGSFDLPLLGVKPAIEYAVHMRSFPQSCMMDRQLACGLITSLHIDKLAAAIAEFHAALSPAHADSPLCSTDKIREAMLQNFTMMAQLVDSELLEAVRMESLAEYAACLQLFEERAKAGCVRECHGDLHLGNIVVLDDIPVPFDGIEFSAALRWIDVISEIAFTVMDLLQRGRPQLAWRLLNAYLEQSGDYSGVGVLRFYLAYRAMVRAKISAIRANQERAKKKEMEACHSYLTLAHDFLNRRNPQLIITCGLPGSGKSTFAQAVLERLGAIRIRSDVERKRLFGLAALEKSHEDIYSEEATFQTYARLHELARILLKAGFTVIVDAAFLRRNEREQFRALARETGAPFVIACLKACEATLIQRLERRKNDASDADISVLRILQAAQEPLLDEENAVSVSGEFSD